MIITKIEPVKLRYYPQKPLRDGTSAESQAGDGVSSKDRNR